MAVLARFALFVVALGLFLVGLTPERAVANTYLKVLAVFQGLQQGGQPMSSVTAGPFGTLFGTPTLGGSQQCSAGRWACGVVFAARPTQTGWTLSTIYGFRGGRVPVAPLLIDRRGDLFGTTVSGGTGRSTSG